MSTASPAFCDKVLSFIEAHVSTHGAPPSVSLMACDLGAHRATISAATAVLIWQGRLEPHLRSATAFADHRNALIGAARAEGRKKPEVAALFGICTRTVQRVPPLTTAG